MMTDVTRDTLFFGALSCRQPKNGYRFSLDSVLLAHFVDPVPGARLVDLAAGCGVVGLIALYRHTGIISCLAVEANKELFFIARENFRGNGYGDKAEVIHGDVAQIKELLPAQSADLVLCNPPYYQPGRGRVSKSPGEKKARHQETPLAAFIDAAAWCLGKGGQAAFIYPAAQLIGLCAACVTARLAVKRLRLVHSYPGAAAARALVLCRKEGGTGLLAMAPLYVYEKRNGRYSTEVARMYAVNPAISQVVGGVPCLPK
ncbi:MAG: methyltransferase [Desulfobulbaceae bacterium]|nr:methyltransferase [Desulfobulbaceae bacterium]